ncbi:MAG TPA: HPr kinase/phosphatase C-terminal domain-containing protein [Aestuariivirga sp.]|nr:HPr kinase/phosphatase C-terminal domain-containing protein [Aestuariivirga sp.]
MKQSQIFLHGTCVSVGGEGVLILGEPGSGKSGLALRLIDEPGYGISSVLLRSELVADDQVIVTRDQDRLVASAPASLRGKLEIRGLGIVTLATQPSVPLTLVVKLQEHSAIERLPDRATFDILGLALPRVEIDAKMAAAPARLRAALGWLKQTGEAREPVAQRRG